jgi:hypothetical protein
LASIPEPDHLSLGDLIARLCTDNPDKRVRVGFGKPDSYRGDYRQAAFEPAESVSVGDMLAAAESALGATFQSGKAATTRWPPGLRPGSPEGHPQVNRSARPAGTDAHLRRGRAVTNEHLDVSPSRYSSPY